MLPLSYQRASKGSIAGKKTEDANRKDNGREVVVVQCPRMDACGQFFGGTNFGRTAGGPNYITSCDYDAPIDEYGLLRQPKWGHLKDMRDAIKLCEPALVAVDSPQYMKLGPKQEVSVFQNWQISWLSVFMVEYTIH